MSYNIIERVRQWKYFLQSENDYHNTLSEKSKLRTNHGKYAVFQIRLIRGYDNGNDGEIVIHIHIIYLAKYELSPSLNNHEVIVEVGKE